MSGELGVTADLTEDNNNALGCSEEALEAQASALRKETEGTIALLRAVQANAQSHYKAGLGLKERLRGEEARAADAVAKADEALGKLSGLQDANSKLEGEVESLKTEVKAAKEALDEVLHGKEGRISELEGEVKSREELMHGLKELRGNVDAFRVGEGILREPCGALVLPDGCIMVADTHVGLLKFSPNTTLLRKVTSDDWKWPQGLAFDARRGRLVVSWAARVEEDGERFQRTIVELDPKDLSVLSSMPGPAQASLDHASRERLALGRAGELYLTLADDHGSTMYKFAGGEWYMVTGRPNSYFADVGVLAQTGPMTEVLVVETKMGYIHKLMVRGWDVADRRSIAAVEKPGPIAVDEQGRLFCQDTMSGKLREIDTRRWEAKRDIAVVDEPLFAVSAASGYLAAAGRDSRTVRVFRYAQDAVKLDDLGLEG